MKNLSFFLFVVFMMTMTVRLAAQDSKAPLPELTRDILQLAAFSSDLGRPYSDAPGNDLRVIVPTLQDRRLELPCALIIDKPQSSPHLRAMELLLLDGGKTWIFVSFDGIRGTQCYHDDYNELMQHWPPPGPDNVIY